MADILPKLFGSTARVKLLRLFLFNPNLSLTLPEVATRTRVEKAEASAELKLLVRLHLISRARGRIPRYLLNSEHPHLFPLQNLFLATAGSTQDMYERLRRAGNIRLVIASGIFMGEWEGRIDLFIVGDRVREDVLRRHIKILESEIGRELRYALMTPQEFSYRVSMNDHLVRDVLDYPHRIVFDRLGIGLE